MIKSWIENKTLICLLFAISLSLSAEPLESENKFLIPKSALILEKEFESVAKKIEVEPIKRILMQQNGRLKPFDTLARESLLFLHGSYKIYTLPSVASYLALAFYEDGKQVEVLEIRDILLREELGFSKSKRYYSLEELQKSQLQTMTSPLIKKQQQNARALDEHEKKILEVYQQMTLLEEIVTGQAFLYHLDFSYLKKEQGKENLSLQIKAKDYFLSLNKTANEQKILAQELMELSEKQEVPAIFSHYLKKVDVEIFYNEVRFFLIAAVLSIFLGVFFFTPLFRNKVSDLVKGVLFSLPLLLVTLGLGIRVYITEFAPVTNMYGTMIWVSFGILLFTFLILLFYKNLFLPGTGLIASGLLLLLTERLPLVLSPDLDPIVAVLRSNFWLSTHVTTITISYAAFSIAMILGNVALVRVLIYKDNTHFIKEYSHYAYRMIQLGCFLLTVGIILGGVWADYSWGRFWGWDPKETWALIADLGFLIILHGRFAGWVNATSLLLWSPVAYLLVIMAWYGVNFILAAGLHSYGFSSGGTLMVLSFLGIQLCLLLAGGYKLWHQRTV